MFEQLSAVPGDPILQLIEMYRQDTNPQKIDVGVGVFKNAEGETPVMRAVSIAEQQLHDTQATKAYVGIAGDADFNAAMRALVFADSVDYARVQALQTPGGSGALRVCAEMLYEVMPDSTVWMSDPTWGNHRPIFEAAGFTVKHYPYFDPATRMVDEARMLAALNELGQGDIVLLHGCCHNPTGSDLSFAAWDRVAEIASQRGFLPFIDLAYQGFGDGLDADLYGIRQLAKHVDDMIVTSSCSKNFGLYRDRVGCALVLAKNAAAATVVKGRLAIAARVSYSMPPDHGGAIVGMILNDATLREQWEDELTEMRNRILSLRQQLADRMRDITGTPKWDFIARHRGMFSLLSLDKSQTDKLIHDYSIYIVNGGRINIAGLRDEAQINRFADALAEVTK
ncbi:amino acid aminotransferase [Ostreibacterium oceani]|uniref:Aminotransferase n=1 Tax=Ostreibacterium oceani TaxID=2654998 RepID=A0A6N7EXD5_9GAMM|nr:amino acid aminotransferase [Ostreibacterium oceani]MPV86059.1 aminotransferase class I/II-fold pyridoxal phosphate-dependent enzyme [Ostreibacterium oceani]